MSATGKKRLALKEASMFKFGFRVAVRSPVNSFATLGGRLNSE